MSFRVYRYEWVNFAEGDRIPKTAQQIEDVRKALELLAERATQMYTLEEFWTQDRMPLLELSPGKGAGILAKFCQNFVKISPNFSKIVIIFCIQYSIFQHFSKSTHF